jgi:aspartate-semialdehyde dehydrogenase
MRHPAIGVLGAPGPAAREVLRYLAERDFPHRSMVALGTGRGVNQKIGFGEDGPVLTVADAARADLSMLDLLIIADEPAVARTHAPRAAEGGALVIDLSPAFRLEAGVPLLLPEVNPGALATRPPRGIIAVPDPLVTQMAVVLHPLMALAPLLRVVAASYESTSGAGKAAMDELWTQARGVYVNEVPAPEQFPKQIAFNLIPQVDAFGPDGATLAEQRMAQEARKLLDPALRVAASRVRVPTFVGHALALHLEFAAPVTEAAARAALRDAEGILLLDRREEGGYATPLDTAGEDLVQVSRIRVDPTVPHGLALWCVADNQRRGGPLTAVMAAELALARGWLEADPDKLPDSSV